MMFKNLFKKPALKKVSVYFVTFEADGKPTSAFYRTYQPLTPDETEELEKSLQEASEAEKVFITSISLINSYFVKIEDTQL